MPFPPEEPAGYTEDGIPINPVRHHRVTPDEIDRIIELKLRQVSFNNIAKDVGYSVRTVRTVWEKWLKVRAAERREDLEVGFEEVVARMERNAIDARNGYLNATDKEDDLAASKYLENERRALSDMARLGIVRQDAPEQAARIEQAKAKAIVDAVRQSVADAQLPPAQSEAVLRAVATRIREIEAPKQDMDVWAD